MTSTAQTDSTHQRRRATQVPHLSAQEGRTRRRWVFCCGKVTGCPVSALTLTRSTGSTLECRPMTTPPPPCRREAGSSDSYGPFECWPGGPALLEPSVPSDQTGAPTRPGRRLAVVRVRPTPDNDAIAAQFGPHRWSGGHHDDGNAVDDEVADVPGHVDVDQPRVDDLDPAHDAVEELRAGEVGDPGAPRGIALGRRVPRGGDEGGVRAPSLRGARPRGAGVVLERDPP